jgi:5'-methylthioadenosine phosphorylase
MNPTHSRPGEHSATEERVHKHMFERAGPGGRIGIIGGSGLASIPDLADARRYDVPSEFGAPSGPVTLGRIAGVDVAFLSRHGGGHSVGPAQINARANIDVLKQVGCSQLISFSAVGSLREELAPGHFVFADQFVDRTYGRQSTFFDEGVVAHVSFADPMCSALCRLAAAAATACGIPHAASGTYVVMNGPQFSTRAESAIYRSWGASLIGMTALPEVKLAREAELCYLIIAMVTDYDCWRTGHEVVTADAVGQAMVRQRADALRLLSTLLPAVAQRGPSCSQGCRTTLDGAIMTDPSEVLVRAHPRLHGLLERWAGTNEIRLSQAV